MHRLAALTIFAALSLIAFVKTDAAGVLLDWRMTEGSLFGSGQHLAPVLIVSWLAWAGTVLCLRLTSTGRDYLPLMLHPAVVIMTAGGLGLAAVALLSVFVSMEQVQKSDSAALVPAIGAGLLAAALFVPRFELVLLAFASPLFLVAPRAMIDRHMVSFYAVALMPALVALGFTHIASGSWLLPSEEGPALIAAGVPFVFAGPASAFLLVLGKAFRLGAALLVVSLGVILTPATTPLWPLMILGLAASFALHRRAPLFIEGALAGSLVLAAFLLTGQMGG